MMNYKRIMQVVLGGGILALVGCGAVQLIAAPRAQNINPDRMMAGYQGVKGIRLPTDRSVQASEAAQRMKADYDAWRRHFNSGTNEVPPTTEATTVGDLKKRGLFSGSVLADHQRVTVLESEGMFQRRLERGGQERVLVFKKLYAMYDPVTGDALAVSLQEE